MKNIQLSQIDLPEFGLPTVQPTIPAATYEARIEAALARAEEAGIAPADESLHTKFEQEYPEA